MVCANEDVFLKGISLLLLVQWGCVDFIGLVSCLSEHQTNLACVDKNECLDRLKSSVILYFKAGLRFFEYYWLSHWIDYVHCWDQIHRRFRPSFNRSSQGSAKILPLCMQLKVNFVNWRLVDCFMKVGKNYRHFAESSVKINFYNVMFRLL